jgi:hypothetical protein
MAIIHRCRYCGKRTRGIAHYRHERHCPERPRRTLGSAVRPREPLQRGALRLRTMVRREVRRQLDELARR